MDKWTNFDSELGTPPEKPPKKLGIFGSFKRYVLSKFRRGKYELERGGDENGVFRHKEQSVEKLDLQVQLDERALDAWRKALQQRNHLEVLEIVEKVFTRQLDIFAEALRRLPRMDNNTANENVPRGGVGPGDGIQVKPHDVQCECQEIASSGAAVPQISEQ